MNTLSLSLSVSSWLKEGSFLFNLLFSHTVGGRAARLRTRLLSRLS